MYNKKIQDKGWATSDPNIAAVLMCAGGEFEGFALMTEKKSPGVVLHSADDKEYEECNFSKATEKVKKFGFDIVGVFEPHRKSYKIFLIKGDEDEFEDIIDRWYGRKKPALEYDVVQFAENHKMLISALKDSDRKIDPEVQQLYTALQQGKEVFYELLEKMGWKKSKKKSHIK